MIKYGNIFSDYYQVIIQGSVKYSNGAYLNLEIEKQDFEKEYDVAEFLAMKYGAKVNKHKKKLLIESEIIGEFDRKQIGYIFKFKNIMGSIQEDAVEIVKIKAETVLSPFRMIKSMCEVYGLK